MWNGDRVRKKGKLFCGLGGTICDFTVNKIRTQLGATKRHIKEVKNDQNSECSRQNLRTGASQQRHLK